MADVDILALGIAVMLIAGCAAFLYAKADSDRRLREKREYIDRSVDTEMRGASHALELHRQHLERMARVEELVAESTAAALREKARRLHRARRRHAGRLTGRALARRRR